MFSKWSSSMPKNNKSTTKMTKVPLSYLRLRKILVSGYIDDFFTKDHTSEGCFNNVMSIAELFDRL